MSYKKGGKMENEMIQGLMNYGAIGICLVYFIYRDSTTLKKLSETVQSLKEVVLCLKERVNSDGGNNKLDTGGN